MFLPPKTRLELSSPAPKGQRHEQAKRIACSLAGQGFSSEGIFAELRSKYEADVSDQEIQGIISWAIGKGFKPCRPRHRWSAPKQTTRAKTIITPEQSIENVNRFLSGFRCDEVDLWEASPWRPLENWQYDSLMLFAGLYDGEDYVNIVTDFVLDNDKAKPTGKGKTLKRNEWMRWIRQHGTPQNEGGAWIRMNPVKASGSGTGGAYCDHDVMSFQFVLLESDILPPNLQLSFFAKLKLPIAAIISSGGKSFHAWIKVDSKDAKDYRQTVSEMANILKRYGMDESNKNPSRMSRLAGAQRNIGAVKEGAQKLLYLNPEPDKGGIFQ